MREQFVKFIGSPDRESYCAIRETLISCDQYDPYSDDLDKVCDLLQSGKLTEVRTTISEFMPNLLLSPRAHFVFSMIAEKTGDEGCAKTERVIGRACVEGMLSTGDGSSDKPYIVVRVSDERDVLEYLDKRLKRQELVHDGDRHLDVMHCEDGSRIWFDITDAYNWLEGNLSHGQ